MNIYPADVVDFDDRSVPSAEAYVATRFYPPLPAEYGVLAVAAVNMINNGMVDDVLILPEDLEPLPRAARLNDGGTLIEIDPMDLVRALKLWHMLDDDSDNLDDEGH